MTYDQAAKKIEKAKVPEDLFGTDRDKALSAYRRLSMAVHPDQAEPSRRIQAEGLFARLGVLWASYSGKGASGGYFTITTRKRAYAVSREAQPITLANLYPCTWMEDDEENVGMMKIPRLPKDNDLMEAEAEVLKVLGAGDLRHFASELVESFRHRDKATKVERRVNVLDRLDGFYSMAEVMAAFPGGLDHRDAAWMFRRLLVAIGFAHDSGYIHGAVLPQNVYIHPELHGLVLTEWCFAVPLKQAMRAWDVGSRMFYAPEVEKKEQVTEATDLFMAAKTLEALVGSQAPAALRAFIRGCTLEWESMRPHNASELLREYDDLIERLYGPRRFRPFAMPA